MLDKITQHSHSTTIPKERERKRAVGRREQLAIMPIETNTTIRTRNRFVAHTRVQKTESLLLSHQAEETEKANPASIVFYGGE